MPVKDALPYLDDAVESILRQTFADFEFVILDDGSRDGSRERLRTWAAKDSRIRLIEGVESLGPVGSSNRVVQEVRAPLVARMDADDVAHPGRLRHQLDLIRANPDVVLVGSVWEGIDHYGEIVREPDRSTLHSGGGFGAPFAHGSVLFRRAAFVEAGGYREQCAYWEDLDLFVRMAALGRVLVSAEPLYRHRFGRTSTRLTSRRPTVENAVDLMFRHRWAYEGGADYPPALRDRRGTERLQPEAFLSIGSLRLWAGERPGALQRLLARGALRLDRRTLLALVWALWAEVSPRSLRQVMRLLLRWRNMRAGKAATGTFEWRPRPEAKVSDCSAALRGNSAGRAPGGAARPVPVHAGYRES